MSLLQPITRELLQKHFGRDAEISQLFGTWTVKTRSGSEIKVSEKSITPIYGGHRMLHAVTALSKDLFRNIQVHGDENFKRAMMAHGDTLSVEVSPNYQRSSGGRWFVAICINLPGLWCLFNGGWEFTVAFALLSWIIFACMEGSAKRDAQRELMAAGHHFPRHVPGDEYASEDDL